MPRHLPQASPATAGRAVGAWAAATVSRGTRTSRIAAVVTIVLVAATASMPWWAERAQMRLATEFLYVLALAQLWNLLAGYGGMLSVGQQAFVGVRAYSLAVIGPFGGVDPFVVGKLCLGPESGA